MTVSTYPDYKPPPKGRLTMPRQQMVRHKRTQRISPRVAVWMMLFGVLLILTPVYAIVAALPTGILAFTTTVFSFTSLYAVWLVNDRNKEIADMHTMHDRQEAQRKITERANSGDYFWDNMNEISRRRSTRAAERAGLCDIPELRIGIAEREQVISKLGDHYAAGRLDRDEFDDRMNKAGQAKTAVQLAELLRDLP